MFGHVEKVCKNVYCGGVCGWSGFQQPAQHKICFKMVKYLDLLISLECWLGKILSEMMTIHLFSVSE